MTDGASAHDAAALFRERYGREPRVVASAAGRVNLIGEHTDYNGGQVLPIAIARRTFVAVDASGARESRTASLNESATPTFTLPSPTPTGGWGDYVAGTCRELASLVTLPGAMDFAVASDVPEGSGLSSSAALEVATAAAVAALAGADIPPRELALAGFRAENGFVGVQSGIMDQFASALGAAGKALHVWCDSARSELVPMNDAVLIFDTAVPRSLRGSAFNERRRECDDALRLLRSIDPELPDLAHATAALIEHAKLPSPLDRRATHVVAETLRVEQTVAALDRGEPIPGDLLLASHESLRDLYECSSPELDWFVEHAMRYEGIRGARLTGAGWGGCAIAVGSLDALDAASAPIAVDYARVFARQPQVWLSRASDGVRVDVAPKR
jgi:galactokinase